MAERPITRTRTERNGFQAAIDELTDGLSRLVRQHFELARTEVREEARQYSRYAAILTAATATLFMGYVMVHLAIILVALWIGGMAAMAITAIVLAILNITGGLFAARYAWQGIQNTDVRLTQTTEELQRNKQWLKEIRDNSSPRRLPAETS